MSVVVEAVESVVDAVDKYIIQPIADDPLTFIATVAATYYLGPIFGKALGVGANIGAGVAAAAGNTAAGLAQGEDFDEAIKGGALAGVTTWAGSALAGKFGSTSTLDDSITAGKTGTSSAASTSNAATVGAQSGDEILAASTKPSSFNVSNEAAKSWSGSGQSAATSASPLDDTLSLTKPVQATPTSSTTSTTTAANAQTQPGANSYAGRGSPTNVAASADASGSGVYTGTKGTGVGNTATSLIDETANVLDEAAARDPNHYLKAQNAVESAAANKVLDTAGTNANILNSPVGKMGTGYMSPSPPVEQTMWDKALGYGKDAYNLAAENKWTTGATLLGLASLAGGDEPPDGGGGNKQVGDPRFYQNLPLYSYNRPENEYLGDIYTYGTGGSGEHRFFAPTVYEPIQYAAGGSVSPDKYGYYTYGNIPPTMKRFAQGGLSALAKGGNYDGRSDDIPAVLSDGEFVIDAETVALLGNGSSKAGANRLEEMRQAVRKQKGGALSRGQFSPDAKSPLAYLKSSKKSRG
jgi:hypothetical protein